MLKVFSTVSFAVLATTGVLVTHHAFAEDPLPPSQQLTPPYCGVGKQVCPTQEEIDACVKQVHAKNFGAFGSYWVNVFNYFDAYVDNERHQVYDNSRSFATYYGDRIDNTAGDAARFVFHKCLATKGK